MCCFEFGDTLTEYIFYKDSVRKREVMKVRKKADALTSLETGMTVFVSYLSAYFFRNGYNVYTID